VRTRSRRVVTREDLSPHDLAEVERFERYLRYRRDNPTVSERDAHAAIYGEIVYPPTTPPGAGEGE
jgi:hypothetical protein